MAAGNGREELYQSKVRGGGREELPHVQGQGQRPRVPGCDSARMAEELYQSKVRGGSQEELPRVQGQGQ